MKHITLVALAVVTLASCSAPKYAYYFDRHDYNAGRKASPAKEASPLVTSPEMLVASASVEPVVLAESTPAAEPTEAKAAVEVRKTYIQMNKAERKALRHHIKSEVKKYVAAKKAAKAEKKDSIQSAQAMDKDLKLAIIFGAVGLVALLIGGDVFWIVGGIAMLIGVVFFVKWIIRQ